jgi:MFS family permease
LIIPYIADNFGRKIAINLSWGLFAVGILFIAIADAPHLIGIGQFLTGFGCNPAITLCYSFLNEQVLGSKRQYYGVIIQVVLAFGECTIALVFLPDYSWQVVCYILLGLVLLILISLRFLV